MPAIKNAHTIDQMGPRVTILFATTQHAIDFFNGNYAEPPRTEPTPSPVELFHQKRGCCDGSNPSQCHAYRVEAAKPRELRTPTERRPRDEYYGTNPND